MNEKLNSLIRQSQIESLKIFQRSKDKTQVMESNAGNIDTVTNRFTHAYIVKTGSELISNYIFQESQINPDYKYSVGNVSLVHDLGHPPFGHMGAEVLDKRFKDLGLKEGFSDNNNNFTILHKNGGLKFLTDYELSSIIKYPEKLYESQKPYLLKILKNSIYQDIKYFEKHININVLPERTISANIMDEADRNAYVCSDLTDCYILGLSDQNSFAKIIEDNKYYSIEIKQVLHSIYSALKYKDKTLIRFSFNNLFNLFNTNYFIDDNIILKEKNEELLHLREELYALENEIFINSDFVIEQNHNNLKSLNDYIDYVLENKFYPSNTYKKLITNSENDIEKYTYIRDMIAESSDWFIHNYKNYQGLN